MRNDTVESHQRDVREKLALDPEDLKAGLNLPGLGTSAVILLVPKLGVKSCGSYGLFSGLSSSQCKDKHDDYEEQCSYPKVV